jgi:hypothetical protein
MRIILLKKLMNRQRTEKTLRVDEIVTVITSFRNELIDQLLSDPFLMKFLEENYNTIAISKIKKEFLRKDLLTLKHSPLDLPHYSALIKKMKEYNESTVGSHRLILTEINSIVSKYVSKIE